MNRNEHDALSRAQVEAIGIPAGEPSFLADPLLDRLLEAAISLGGEVWVERERRMFLESLLVSKGVLTTQELENYLPDKGEREAQAEALKALVNRVLGPLKTLSDQRNQA